MGTKEIRRRARGALRGNWLRMAGLQLMAGAVLGVLGVVAGFAAMAPLTFSALQGLDHLLYGAEATSSELTSIPAAFFVIVGLGLLLALAAGSLMAVGMFRASRAVLRGEMPQPAMLFPLRLLGRALAMNLARLALILAQTLLLIVPGVLAAYRYAMADYLLATHSDLGPIEALRRSSSRMNGHRLELFKLQLSFLGWALLCALPAGAVQFWQNLSSTGNRGALLPLLNLAALVGGLFVAAYLTLATTLFFRHLDRKSRKHRPSHG